MADESTPQRTPATDSPYRSPETGEKNQQATPGKNREAWLWVPSLYFAEGLPYVIVMSVSVIMYKSLGIPNDRIALYTSLLYLPWVIKPLWSPLVDVLGSQRSWIVGTQLLMSVAFLGVGLMVESADFFPLTLAFLWLMAVCSATHDIAADGFYMAGMDEKSQAWFVGIRSTFYRLATIAGQGGLVMLAGLMEGPLGPSAAWRWTMVAVAALYAVITAHHYFNLPRPASDEDKATGVAGRVFTELFESVSSFFKKPGIGLVIAYLLLYRFSEGQLAKIAPLFLKDTAGAGGLELSTAMVGTLYGVLGVLLLLAGGILGGMLGARDGVRRWLLPMAAAINLPNIVYVLLAFAKPTSIWVIGAAVAVEQFGYGLGFAGYLLVMLHASRGEHQTAHYAICTGLMALGMMLPGMISGDLQNRLGYSWFFVWVLGATVPSFLVTALLASRMDDSAGAAEPAAQ